MAHRQCANCGKTISRYSAKWCKPCWQKRWKSSRKAKPAPRRYYRRPAPARCPRSTPAGRLCGGLLGVDQESYYCFTCGWRGYHLPLHLAAITTVGDEDEALLDRAGIMC